MNTQPHTWYRLTLGDATLATEGLRKIETQAKAFFGQAGNPSDTALLIRHESYRHLHCELVVYFSPKAFSLAQVVDALPWPMPCPEGLSLWLGKTIAWQLLFPNYRSGR